MRLRGKNNVRVNDCSLRYCYLHCYPMASIRKHPKSKYWFACITLPDGRQTQRSTKQTDAKKAAAFAEKLEAAGRAKLSEKQARKIVSEIFEMMNGEKLPGSTAREFFTKWATNKKRETAEATGRDTPKSFNNSSEQSAKKLSRT